MTRADISYLLLCFAALAVLLLTALMGIGWAWAEYYHWNFA